MGLSGLFRALEMTSKWQVRCTACGRTRTAEDAGMSRNSFPFLTKTTMVWCSNCRKMVLSKVEPQKS